MRIVRVTDGTSETYGFLKDNKIAIKSEIKIEAIKEIKTSKSYDTNASFKLSKRMLNYLDIAKKEAEEIVSDFLEN